MPWFRRLSNFNTSAAPSAPGPTRDPSPTPENKLLFQSFEWHTPSEPPSPHETHCPRSHWSRLTRILPSLAELGVSSIWLPPGCKAGNSQGNGYDCYDLWDLGEFDQKWSRSTKWGSREELSDLLSAAEQCGGIELIWDAVLNHKAAADATDEAWAVEVDSQDRRIEISSPGKIEAWLKYDFPGREREGMKHSSFKWRAEHFNGTDWDQRAQKNAIFKLIDDPETSTNPVQGTSTLHNRPSFMKRSFSRLSETFNRDPKSISVPPTPPKKGWAEDVDKMLGNYDYLMFSNIYYAHPDVRADVLRWGQWMVQDIGVHGFRFDAAKHFSTMFTSGWIAHTQAASQRRHGKHALVIGEVWDAENTAQLNWLDAVTPPGCPHLAHAFDAPLLYNFSRVSEDVRNQSFNADLRTILTGSGNPDKRALMLVRPHQAVTLVTNHDTQPGQISFSPMDAGHKTLFYAFILLRREGLPCVFWGDLYGTQGPYSEQPACQMPWESVDESNLSRPRPRSLLPTLMLARKLFAYGSQRDYFDSMPCIGWTRAGTHDRPGCAVVLSIMSASKWASKRMAAGRPGERWVNVLCEDKDKTAVVIDEKGFGVFTCHGTGVGLYISESTTGKHEFPIVFDHDVYGP